VAYLGRRKEPFKSTVRKQRCVAYGHYRNLAKRPQGWEGKKVEERGVGPRFRASKEGPKGFPRMKMRLCGEESPKHSRKGAVVGYVIVKKNGPGMKAEGGRGNERSSMKELSQEGTDSSEK